MKLIFLVIFRKKNYEKKRKKKLQYTKKCTRLDRFFSRSFFLCLFIINFETKKKRARRILCIRKFFFFVFFRNFFLRKITRKIKFIFFSWKFFIISFLNFQFLPIFNKILHFYPFLFSLQFLCFFFKFSPFFIILFFTLFTFFIYLFFHF